MSDLKFTARAFSESPAKTVIETRSFKIIVDEPESLGGTDLGANPVEYVLAALAGCLNVVGHMIARELDFVLRGIELELEGDLNPDKLFGTSNENRAGYSEIRVKITPDADADQEVLAKWLEIVKERCPVSDNLANPTSVSINLG
jgi:uncharacterized OsmC-like protein